VREVAGGEAPQVSYSVGGETSEACAPIVVGADGRSSMMRKHGRFDVKQDPQRRFFAGVLMDGLSAPEDTLHSRFAPADGLVSWIFPQGSGRVRTYIGYHAATDFERLSGERDLPRFIDTAVRLGVPAEQFAGAVAAGPLVTFDATDNWVDHPYSDGIALIGDAASTSDPTWGQGMSHTLRDVRVLVESLEAHPGRDEAGHAYAEEHDRAHAAGHAADGWYCDLLLEIGDEADAVRARTFPLMMEDPMLLPDTPISGPHIEPDQEARRRMFAPG